MKVQWRYRFLNLILMLLIILMQEPETYVLARQATGVSGAAATLTLSGSLSAVGETSTASNGPSLLPATFPPALLARQDYQNVYDQAQALWDTASSFRVKDLALRPTCTGAKVGDCLQNYKNFHDGNLFYRYCATYDQIDVNGYCHTWDSLSDTEKSALIPDSSKWLGKNDVKDIRNILVRAREMFGFLALAQPADLQITVAGKPRSIRDVGKTGVLSATREIANIHMIFGNEFMVDALDYRFGGHDSRADQIINEEINQLQDALQQFELAVDTLSFAYNADFGGPSGAHIGDYFGPREFELFGIVSQRMVTTIGEIADRYRQLGQDDKAVALYKDAFGDQYIQGLALATSAARQHADFLQNGGWEIMNNLESLRARSQAIQDGINPFGFVKSYVPLQTYDELRKLTENELLRDATEDEAQAANAAREFDQNRTALNTELQNLRLTYNNQLLELCGPSQDNYQTCEGGLMAQNRNDFDTAVNRIVLAQRRLLDIPEQVKIEQERAGKVIQLTLKSGQQMAAYEYIKGLIESVRTTRAIGDTSSEETYHGDEFRVEVSAGFNFPLPSFGYKESASFAFGQRWSDSHQESVTTVWDPAAKQLGSITSLEQVQQAAKEAAITNANSEATIRNLLLQQAQLMIEVNLAGNEYNRVVLEHNQLVDRYHNWLNLRIQAQDNVADSYLTNPAYRILRDSLTVEAARSHAEAAQFAYLTAKALEYEYLIQYPALNDVFKVRTADDIDNFLNQLEIFRTSINSPGQRNRYPYHISLAKDLLGLSDKDLNPNGKLSSSQVADKRFAEFQRIFQQHAITDTTTGKVVAIAIPFSTSLLDNRIFSPNIWNNRIAGVGLPADVPGTQGIALNLVTRQFGDIGTPEVLLTHSGHASYRTATDAIVEYVPENAKPAGYTVPPGFESKNATATILASVNGNARGTPSSAFFNRSVAASSWMLRINLDSPFNATLDVRQLEDVELNIDTTGVALANQAAAAQADAARLQSATAANMGR